MITNYHTHYFGYENPLKIRLTTEFIKRIPTSPGVYFMLDRDKTILYIGKAKNLRNRLSTYFSAKPGKTEEHTLEMLERVSTIHFELCLTEQEAIDQEKKLLHAIRPPYNIADTEPEHYLFIGTRFSQAQASFVPIDFQLSRYYTMKNEGYQVHGCFQHRPKVKRGYTALLRLLHALGTKRHRFSYPAKITRVSPPWLYSTFIPKNFIEPLNLFLSGKSVQFIHLIFDALLENEFIPIFMYPSLQEDLNIAKAFFELGPQNIYKLKQEHKISKPFITHKQLDKLIIAQLKLSA